MVFPPTGGLEHHGAERSPALMAGENVTERIVRKVFSQSLDLVTSFDRRGSRGAQMTLIASLAVGVFVYFLVGFATGYAPEIKIRRFRPRKQISNRQLRLNQAGVEVANTHP